MIISINDNFSITEYGKILINAASSLILLQLILRVLLSCQIRLHNIYFIFTVTFMIDLVIDQCDPIGRSTRHFAPIEVPAYNYFPHRLYSYVYLSIDEKARTWKESQSAAQSYPWVIALIRCWCSYASTRDKSPAIITAQDSENYDRPR